MNLKQAVLRDAGKARVTRPSKVKQIPNDHLPFAFDVQARYASLTLSSDARDRREGMPEAFALHLNAYGLLLPV